MRTLPFVAAATLFLTLPAAASAAPRDRNGDGIPDSWERKHRLALVSDQDQKDQDRDGLTNLVEWQAGTNPRRKDSDRDGRPDGREDADKDGLRNGFEGPTGHDAGDPDTDDDGVKDGKEGAGRVTRMSGATITIDRGNGRTWRGTVADETVSRCGLVEDWLQGLFDLPEEDELPGDEISDVVDDLAPQERSADEEEPVDEEDVPVLEDEPADDGQDAEGACAQGAVAKDTWIHSSALSGGAFSWLDVVVDDED